MSHANEPSFLAKLADLFRTEGDTATADALVTRCASTSARSISDEDHHRILALQRKGIQLDNQGAHAEAEGWFSGALVLIEYAFGPEHVAIIDHLNDLARCRLSGGDYDAALNDYSRLLRITKRAYGPDDMLVKIARECVERCRKGLRDTTGAWRLQAQMDLMLQHASGSRAVDAKKEQDSLRNVAGRLLTRGRHAWAVRLYERWIGQRLRDAPPDPDDDLALLDIRDYAMALRRAGELARAASVLQMAVAMRNRRSAWDSDRTEFLRDLSDWQSCLLALGQVRSATETARLADSIAAERGRDGWPSHK